MSELIKVGTFKLTGTKLYLSDPCYSRGRDDLTLTVNRCDKGTWEAFVDMNKYGRVASLVVHNPNAEDTIGNVDVFDGQLAVDSGQMGVYDNKFFPDESPGDFDDTESFYRRVCDITLNRRFGVINNFGVVSSSGWGDGCYTAAVYRNEKGRVKSILVDFHCGDEVEEEIQNHKPFDIKDLCVMSDNE